MDKMFAQLINGLVKRGGMSWVVGFPDEVKSVFTPYKTTHYSSPDYWLVQDVQWTTRSIRPEYLCYDLFVDELQELNEWCDETPSSVPVAQLVYGFAKVKNDMYPKGIIEIDVSNIVLGKDQALALASQRGSQYIWNPIHGVVPTTGAEYRASIVQADPAFAKHGRHAMVYELSRSTEEDR